MSTPESATVVVRRLSAAERSPRWRRRIRRRERVGRSLVLVPAGYLVGAVVLGIVLPAIDRARGAEHLLGIDASSAQTVLESIAAGMIAFSGLVVSVAVLVVQFGAGQYSPRLVQSFRRDPVIKNALGLFVAPGVYALVAAADVGGGTDDAVQSLTVVVGLLLMVVALLALFRFIGRLLDLMRPRRIYARLAEQARGAIEDVYPFLLDEAVSRQPLPEGPVTATVLHEHRDGVVAAVDRALVLRVAAAAGAVIESPAEIGSHVPHEAPLFIVHGGSGADVAALRDAVVFADGRTITQDPAFAIRCMVDVAIRALSPAVNDPTSGVEGLDALEAILGRLGRRRLGSAGICDDDGTLRLVLRTPGWHELMDLALTEIRRYGADSPQIARRMRALLFHLRDTLAEERQPAVERHLALLDAAVEAAYPDAAEWSLAVVPDRLGLGG